MIVAVRSLHHVAFRASAGTTGFRCHFGTAIIIIIIINDLSAGCLQLYTSMSLGYVMWPLFCSHK